MVAQDIVINFDDLPVNTVVTNQYHDKGVDFFGPPNGGLLPVITQVPPGEAHSGNQVANISTCFGCEFFTPFSTGRFTNTVEHISMYVGEFDGQPDTAQLTLSAFDTGHNLLAQSAPVTVTAGGGFNTLLSVEVAAGNIASFEVSARVSLDASKQLGMDDLSFIHPEHASPDFNLTSAPSVVQVAPGTSVSDLITVNRFNGSQGAIQFTASDLPQGVTATFSPNPTSDNTTLILTAAASAPLTTGTIPFITVIAAPLSPSVGLATRTIRIGVQVQHNFTLSIQNATIALAPCMTNAAFTVDVIRLITFQSQQIDLSISGLPAGVSATLNPSSVGTPPAGGSINEVTLELTVTDASFPDADVTITGQSGGETNTLTLHLHSIPGGIDSFTPISGQTPQELHPVGTEVVIQGTGFCQGSQVAFGNDTIFINGQQQPLAIAVPTSISADGRTIHVNVPLLATDGPLSVLTSSGHTYVSRTQFTVDSYRNTDGFSFRNFDVTGVSFEDDVVELFGFDQTHLSFFGLFSLPIPDPLALIFTLIADATLGHDKACHGFALSSQRFLHRDEAFSNFPRSGDSVWLLNGPDPGGASGSLHHYIHVQHITQQCAEFVHYWLGQVASHILGGDGSTIKAQVVQAFTNNDHPLVAIRKGTSGHVLVAYHIEDSTTGPGDFYIDVYDPNDPFVTVENSQGQTHSDNTEKSRILVQGNGNWSFPNLGWSGGLDSIVVVPYGIIPLRPTIPTSLSGLITVILGSGGKTTQLADTAGHTLLLPDGKLNRNPATLLPQAAPFAPLDSEASADIHVLEGVGPYIHTVQSTGNAPYTHTHLSQNFATRIENVGGSQGSGDEVTLDPQASGLGFRTWETRRSIRAHLLARAPDNDVRTAIFNTTSFNGHGDHFAFDQARQVLTYTHAGAATSYSFTLEGTNQQGQRTQFVSPALQIQSNDTATFAPSDWHGLARATVTVTTTRSDGTSQVQTLSNQDQVITEVAGYFTPIDGFQHAIAATRDGKVHEVYFNPQSGIAQDVLSTFSNITSIAGYFTPIDGFQHVIVATADGNVHEVYFNPQKGIFQDVLAHFDGIIEIAGFFTPDDDFQHVLVATQDGNLHEIYFNPQKGIFQDVFAHFDGIVAIDGFFTPDDNYRHAIVATSDGNLHEVYFHPQKGIFQDVLAHLNGIVDVAGFFTPDDNYRHTIVATSDGNLHEVYFHPQKGIFQDVLTHFDGIGRIGGYFTPTDGNRHVIVATNDGALHEVYFNPQKGIFQDVLTTFTA